MITDLDRWVAYRRQVNELNAKIKAVSEGAIDQALTQIMEQDNGKKTFDYGNDGKAKITVSFRSPKIKPSDDADLETIHELLQLEQEKAELVNKEVLASKRLVVEALTAEIEQLANTNDGRKLAKEYEAREATLKESYKTPVLALKGV